MKKTVFFDVETNNGRNDRICQLAMIYEEDGKEVFRKCYLINPESPFSDITISIHGITPEMVKDAPTFPEVWKEIHEYFETSLVVAHNICFDRAVLDKVLQCYDIKADAMTCADTMKKANCVSDYYGSTSLDCLCEYLDVPLLHHHDAMCDTDACRKLYHLFDKISPWTKRDEETYRFGKAKLKADPNARDKALLDLDGIVYGIISDGSITTEEFSSVEEWRDTHAWQRKYPGFKEVYSIVDEILATGTIPEDFPVQLHAIARKEGGKLYSNTTVSLQILKGIINGIIADNEISENEIISLHAWMSENEDQRAQYPFDILFHTIERVLEDDYLSKEEKKVLLSLFRRFANPLAREEEQDVSVDGKNCCLSGNFHIGSKAEVEKIIAERGGNVVPSLTKKTDLLIVGGMGSSAWAYGNYGSKVKKALKMQEEGHSIRILGESEVF